MILWASSETDALTGSAVDRTRRRVQPHLNALLEASALSKCAVKIRYVPIVMPSVLQARYPARSKVLKKDHIYDCAPQLDYDVFLNGTPSAQLACYLEGLRECANGLSKLGVTTEQSEIFLNLLDTCQDDLSEM